MKRFKKKGFWVLYVSIVLAGAFVIVALCIQNQSPGVPDVSAQENALGFQYTPTAYSLPADYAFMAGSFPQIWKDGSNGKREMSTIMTCSGCAQTLSTCDWKCGPTFTQCGRVGQGSMLGLLGDAIGTTFYTFGTCPTMSTCPPRCIIGGDTWLLCRLPDISLPSPGGQTYGGACVISQTYGSALLCVVIRGNTLSTCIGCSIKEKTFFEFQLPETYFCGMSHVTCGGMECGGFPLYSGHTDFSQPMPF